jgi:nucleotide-binding universal stress UspA family protein
LWRVNDSIASAHGRSGVARAALGSVAEALIRGSGVPVVAVHEDDAMRTGPIGVAIDASPAAQAALDTAIRIAAARGIPLALIHVCDASDAKAPQVNALLDEAARRARAGGARTDVHVCQGDVEPAIRGTAERLECCMIAMGTHGRHPLGRLVFGSVAAAVVEHATVPVLTVR